MTYLPSPQDAVPLHILRAYPEAARPLLDYHQVLPPTATATACTPRPPRSSASPRTPWRALLSDVDTAPVDERLKPVLCYVGKLTFTPTRMASEDAAMVFAAARPEVDYFAVSARRLADIGYGRPKQML